MSMNNTKFKFSSTFLKFVNLLVYISLCFLPVHLIEVRVNSSYPCSHSLHSFSESSHHSFPDWNGNINYSPYNCTNSSIEFLPVHKYFEFDNEAIYSFPMIIENHILKVAVTFTPVESLFKAKLPNGSLANIYGSSNVAYAVLLDLQEIFQFRIKVVPSVGWMTQEPNGALAGVGAQVHFGEADIGIDLSKPVIYRARHLTFLHAIKQDRVAIMFRQPRIQTYRNILARPFKDGLWKRVLQCFFALVLSTIIISKRRDIHGIFLAITGAFMARSVHMSDFLKRSTKSFYIVLFVTSLFGFTMYSIYSAFIVSSLKKQAPTVKRFQDLLDYNYELLAQRSLPDFTNVYFSDSREGRRYASIAKKNFVNEKVSLSRLFHHLHLASAGNADEAEDYNDARESTKVAWFVLKSDFYYLALQNNYSTREICDISSLEPTSRPEHPRLLSMYIGKKTANGSTAGALDGMKEHFNRRILDVMARGLGHRYILRFENEFQPKCIRRRRTSVQQIRFYDVYFAYWILLCGAGLSCLAMIIGEILLPLLWKVTKLRSNFKHYDGSEKIFVFVSKGSAPIENISGEPVVDNRILW